jgi:hypothetical protein
MAALKALSDNFYISVILVLHLLSFSIQVEIFLDKWFETKALQDPQFYLNFLF